jgi:hypothetical protein
VGVITIGSWHISAYLFGEREGSFTVYLGLSLAATWLATMWWRDPKPADGMSGEATTQLGRRRTRIVKYSIAAIAVAWVLLMVAAEVYAVQSAPTIAP